VILDSIPPERRAPLPGSSVARQIPILGIVGGMGPLASNELLRTIYKLHLTEPEQGSPRCVLSSDPTFPDRTSAICDGRIDLLSERLTRAVADLLAMGCSRVVIACITAHCALPFLPEPLRRRIVSLLDLTVSELLACGPDSFLLLTTRGTRIAQLFERHAHWGEVAGRVLFPDAVDQERLHAWIYRLKGGDSGDACLDWLGSLRDRYGVAGLVFGCTELHLLQEPLAARGKGDEAGRIIDPLWVTARDLYRLLADDMPSGGDDSRELDSEETDRQLQRR
jgi:aspartate racemase